MKLDAIYYYLRSYRNVNIYLKNHIQIREIDASFFASSLLIELNVLE